jgi:hypothetical protein
MPYPTTFVKERDGKDGRDQGRSPKLCYVGRENLKKGLANTTYYYII